MVVVGDTVTEAPVPSGVPPQDPENQFHVAPVPSDPPATVSVVGPPQVMVGLAEADVGATDKVLKVTVTDAQVVLPQPPPSALTK